MNDTLNWIGGAGIALSLVFAIAGVGWWRFAVALLVSLVIAVIAAAGVGWVVWKVAFSFEHGGGEWRGLGSLAVAAITMGAVFLVVILGLMIVLAVTRRAIFRRAKTSFVVLGISALLAVAGMGAFALNTPQHASNEQLIRQLEQSWLSTEIEDELARRGSAPVPTILAELQRLSKPGNTDGYLPHDAPPLLRMLGRLGGPGTSAELQKWAESDGDEGIRVASVVAMAEQGIRAAIPFIVEFLGKSDGQWPWQRGALLEGLGKLKAADQVGTIRDAMSGESSNQDSRTVPAGIAALVAIDTDAAWEAIAEMCDKGDKRRRCDILTALQKVPGARTVHLAAMALDDPEPSIREAGFWTLYRVEPTLFTGLGFGWSEENGGKLRETLKTRDAQGRP